jgi:hypothetical protein
MREEATVTAKVLGGDRRVVSVLGDGGGKERGIKFSGRGGECLLEGGTLVLEHGVKV